MLLAILRAGGDTRVYTYGHADRRNVSGVETYRRISARERETALEDANVQSEIRVKV